MSKVKGKYVAQGKSYKRVEKRRKLTTTRGFKFDSKLHRYTLDGVELLSTTKLISRYERPFERVFISQNVATKNAKLGKKYLKTDGQVRRYWKYLGERASALGTSGHAFCAQYWMDPDSTVPIHQIEVNALKAMQALQSKFKITNMEVSRGNKRYMMGYTIDLEMVDRDTGELVLGDFKFTKLITSEHYKEDKGRLPQYLKPPFRAIGLRSVGLDKGEIQLNIYRKLYEIDTGKKVAYTMVIHIDGTHPDRDDWYEGRGYYGYKCRNLQSVVTEILKPHATAEQVDVPKSIIDKM